MIFQCIPNSIAPNICETMEVIKYNKYEKTDSPSIRLDHNSHFMQISKVIPPTSKEIFTIPGFCTLKA